VGSEEDEKGRGDRGEEEGVKSAFEMVRGGRGGGWVSEGIGVYCLVQLGMRVLGSDVSVLNC
jgi:hypothetical protein